LKRGRLEIIGEFLSRVEGHPYAPPSRITGGAGLIYAYVNKFVAEGFVEIVNKNARERHLRLTEKGKLAVERYNAYVVAVGDFLQ